VSDATQGLPAVRRVATFSWGINKLAHASALIGCRELIYRPRSADGIDAVVGWGLKDNTIAAVNFAHRHGLPYWRLEDGFLRSVGLGVNGDTALSMVIDEQGMYYDARRPSRLETILAEDGPELDDPSVLERARTLMESIREHGLSKYNDSPVAIPKLPKMDGRERVLVVDQTAGDLSVACGLGKRESFQEMLAAALRENPEAEIIVKTHPDVLAGKKQGYFGTLSPSPRVRVSTESANPIRFLEQVDKVYVVTSQLGFEALILGKPVVCFGAPFYSGWGLTDDRVSVSRRGRTRSLEQVFAAAYLLYTRYVDPNSGKRGRAEDVVDHLRLQRREFARNEGRIFCFGFLRHFWKQNYVRDYLRCPGNDVLFPRSASHALRLGFDSSCKLLVWGQRAGSEVSDLAERFEVDVWRMEDGFLRSVGLGSDMATPASLVVDRLGIYYDPRTPSELEALLQRGDLDAETLQRGKRLRARLLESGLSKYNVGDQNRALPIDPGGRTVILVPGQVEDDASIQLGCPEINRNIDLLGAARSACPDAFIIFKPHPDVLSGNRSGNVEHAVALEVCDHIEEDASLAQCLQVAEQVHVMTSLVGFEALLRGLQVHCYGQPFYAGWGLTTDHYPVERRTRRLSLDELVAGTYLLYPRYLNRKTHRFTTAESVVDQLEADVARGAEKLKVGWGRRQLRKLGHIAKEVTRDA
jgi:capsular polysaccharide export protein